MKEFGIIGYPLSHSFSKRYFSNKFLVEGITGCTFTPFPLRSLTEFSDLIYSHPGLKGLNVTIPYKMEILPYLTDRSVIPLGLDACNCIRINEGELKGFNTDIIGFEQALLPLLHSEIISALILGNGGAAAAVRYVLDRIKIKYKTVVRNITKGAYLSYEQLDEKYITEHKLIINTTPLGTYPKIDECPPIPYLYLTPVHILFDLVYNPEKTLFLQKGEEMGAVIENGYRMLVLQAEESWKIWNNG